MSNFSGAYTQNFPAIFFNICGNQYFPDNFNELFYGSGNTQSLDMYYSGATTNITTPYYYDLSNNWYYDLSSRLQQVIYNNMDQVIPPPLSDRFNNIV